METTFETKKRHHGYNSKRLREILGVKQEDLAERMGVSQQSVSRFEQTETLEDDILNKIAEALKIPVEAIKNYSDDATINIVANTFQDDAMSGWYAMHYQCTFNPLDKVIELYNEKVELYERMLKAEQEKVSLLEEVLKGKK